jgi:hypothetical protein
MFFYEVFEGNSVKCEPLISEIEAILRKVKALLDQIKICVFHRFMNPSIIIDKTDLRITTFSRLVATLLT